MEKYKSKIRHAEENDNEKNNSINQIMSRYNLENFNEILNSSFEGPDKEIDEEKPKDFQDRIDHFSVYMLQMMKSLKNSLRQFPHT
jgi:hypothetical protein